MFYKNGRKIYTSENGRKSIRLKGYDYSQPGLYFITICCQDRAHLFGEVRNGEMILNEFGKIAYEEWVNSENVRDNIKIHEFIIMPNHIHGIIKIIFQKDNGRNGKEIGEFKSPSQTIGAIIRGYKIATIKKIKDLILESEKNKKKIQEKSQKNEIGQTNFKDLKIDIPKKEIELETKLELNSEGRTDELQFVPTAPTAPTRIIRFLNFKIWQRNYYEHIIKDSLAYHNISNYIINNPKKWKEDKFN